MSSAVQSPAFESSLTSRQEVAERTFAFHFEKPAGWTFEPGQTIDVTLLNPSETDAEGDTRTFSIASAPHDCSSCHGAGGRGGEKASSIVDGSFLALLNDQELRTIVIVGRPELGAPDWRNNVPGKPMTAQDVSDVVAWLASQRPKFPGQPYPSVAKTAGEAR